MRFVEAGLRALTIFGGVIGVGSIVLLMALTVVTVVFRAIGIAFPGTYVIAELLLIPAVSFSLVYAAYSGAHTRVDLLVTHLPERTRSLVEAGVTALGMIFWALVSYAGIREAIRHAAQAETTPIINLPVSPFRWLMVFALVLFCAILTVQALKAARGETTSRMGDPEYNE